MFFTFFKLYKWYQIVQRTTYDGTRLNISTIKNLRCEFTDGFKSMKTSLTHPAVSYQVYATLDNSPHVELKYIKCIPFTKIKSLT